MSLSDQHGLNANPPVELDRLGKLAQFYGIEQSDNLEAVAEAIQITMRRLSPIMADMSSLIAEKDTPEALNSLITLAIAGQQLIDHQAELTEITKTMSQNGYIPVNRENLQLQAIFRDEDPTGTTEVPSEQLVGLDATILDITPLLQKHNLAERLAKTGATFEDCLQIQHENIMTALGRVIMIYENDGGELSPELKQQLAVILDNAEKYQQSALALGTEEPPALMMEQAA